MLNNCDFIGRMVKDPEMRYTQNNVEVCSFTIAVERDFAGKETDFIDCVAWRGNATFVSQHFKKGQFICVNGRLQSRKWEDRNGNKRINWEILVNESYFWGKSDEVKPVTVQFEEEPDDGQLPF